MWFTPTSRTDRDDARGGDARRQPRDGDPARFAAPVELRPAADPTRARRSDRRRAERVSRTDRELVVLSALGLFRVVSRKALVAECFDGHSFAAGRTQASLERSGLVVKRRVARGQRGYYVLSLTALGRDRLAAER